MKKFIILGLVVLFVFLSAQGLYKVNKPARFSSWIKIGGDFIPIWDGRSNLGHSSYWFDSSFVEHGWFNYIQIDSGGYLKLDSLSVAGDLTVSGITTFDDASVWILDDTLFFTDGTVASPGEDTTWMVNTGTSFKIGGDLDVEFLKSVTFGGYLFGGHDGKDLLWDGKWSKFDYDADDSLSGITFGNTDTLKWDSIPEIFTLTAGLIIDDGANDTTKIDSTGIYTTGKITATSIIRGQATFSAVCLIDTIEIAGITTNSFVFLTVKSATAPTSNLSWAYLNTDSITVHCLVADTALLRVNPYSWFRIE